MADGGRAPGAEFILNTSEALAKPYELTHPLNAEQVANADEMLRYLFNALRENEIKVDEIDEEVEELVVEVEELTTVVTTGTQVVTVSVPITAANISVIVSSPLVLVPAQGANTVVVPFLATVLMTTTDAYTSNALWVLKYAGRVTNISGTQALGLSGVQTVIANLEVVGFPALDVSVFDYRNKALVLTQVAGSSDPINGVATGRIVVSYLVHTGVTL